MVMKKVLEQLIHSILDYIRGEQKMSSLQKKGLIVGEAFHKMKGCYIDEKYCQFIKMGDNVRFAPCVKILAHDDSALLFLGKDRIAEVNIGNNVWLGAHTIVMPGATIGNRVVIGAGSVVYGNIPSNSLAVGNPARVIKSLDEYIAKEKARMNPENTFSGFDPDTDIAQREHIVAMAEKYGEIFIG